MRFVGGVVRVAALAGAGVAALKVGQAKAKQQSVLSVLYEDYLWFNKRRKSPTIDIEAAKTYSATPFELPGYARGVYDVEELDTFTDTFLVNGPIQPGKRVIVFFHGGSYWHQPTFIYYPFLNRLAETMDAHVVMPVYPKAPTHTAVDMHEMARDRYRYLIETKGVRPEDIILMGDSAGGGLALGLMADLPNHDLPLPGHAWLISPWLDIACTNEEMAAIEPKDPVLNRERLIARGVYVLGDLSPTDPRVSPLFADLSNMPPITVISATHDLLHADVKVFEAKAKAEHLPVTVHTFTGLFHCFPCAAIPESDQALARFKATLT